MTGKRLREKDGTHTVRGGEGREKLEPWKSEQEKMARIIEALERRRAVALLYPGYHRGKV